MAWETSPCAVLPSFDPFWFPSALQKYNSLSAFGKMHLFGVPNSLRCLSPSVLPEQLSASEPGILLSSPMLVLCFFFLLLSLGIALSDWVAYKKRLWHRVLSRSNPTSK